MSKNGRSEEGDYFCWYKDDQLHREDGPAIEYVGLHGKLEVWYRNGFPHREDGPAVVKLNGKKEW